jgi:hypothetical protein
MKYLVTLGALGFFFLAAPNTSALGPVLVSLSITKQPQSLKVGTGATATFTVVAVGTHYNYGSNYYAPVTYQWLRHGVPVTGNISAATATLILTNVHAIPDEDDYSVIVSDGVSPDVPSALARLTVYPEPDGLLMYYSASPYFQHFDTLPAADAFNFSGNGPYALGFAVPNGLGASGLAGWSFAQSGGSSAHFRADNGTDNSSAAYSYGSTGATDRALGTLGSGTAGSRVGVTCFNASGRTISQVLVTYTGEQWRHGGSTTPGKLAFSYAVGASDLNTGAFTPAPALDFTAPIATSVTGALDGTAPANCIKAISSLLTNLNWAPDQTLVLRWTDDGSSDGLAIDDFILSEPLSQELIGQLTFLTRDSPANYPTHFVSDGATYLYWSATSGLPFTATLISGPAILNSYIGNGYVPNSYVFSPTGAAGKVVIRISQAGNYAYFPAEDATVTYTLLARPEIYLGAFLTSTAVDVVRGTLAQPTYTVAANIATDGQTSTLLGALPGSGDLFAIKFSLNSDGTFAATTTPAKNPVNSSGATTSLTVRGQIGNGVLSGSIDELGLSFAANLQPAIGNAVSYHGSFQARALNTFADDINLIVSSQGDAFALFTSPSYFGALNGTVVTYPLIKLSVGPYFTGLFHYPSEPNFEATLAVPGQPPTTYIGRNTEFAATDQLVNISSRTRIAPNAGDNTLIIGFILAGTEPKRILFRAVGPGLADHGVADFAADPQLRVYDSAGRVVTENDDWRGDSDLLTTSRALIGAFTLSPDSKDAAVVTTLAPGAYTMHVFTTAGAGQALGEIYDASLGTQDPPQRLVNVSMRGPVDSSSVLIAGFVITGDYSKRVLIRAAGPALTSFGVTNALSNPLLSVYSSGTMIALNDNWETPAPLSSGQTAASAAALTAAAAQVSAFPFATGSKDAALGIVLAPGAYTAHVSGVNGTTGVALVEIYEISQ